MPIYEYSCKKCRKTIEVIQKFSDPVLKKHKGCGGTLTKLISQSGFQFKGTGWYVTDYARKGKGGESESSRDSGEAKEAKEAKDSKATKESKDTKESAPKSETSATETPKKTSGKSAKSGD